MATLRELESRLDLIARRLEFGVGVLVTAIATHIAQELIPATPVDTGRARGNWRPALNAPPATPISVLDPTGQATISRIAVVAARFRPGDTLFISNLVEYIGQLNRGSSPQAPPEFVEMAIERGFRSAVNGFQSILSPAANPVGAA